MSAAGRGAVSEKEPEPQVTHWPDCWRDPKHHACAARKVEELMELSESQEKALSMMERGLL